MEALVGFELDVWDYLTFLNLLLCVVALGGGSETGTHSRQARRQGIHTRLSPVGAGSVATRLTRHRSYRAPIRNMRSAT